MPDLTEYDAPNTEMTIDELAFEANEYERRSTKGIQWVIIYKINSGERLLAIQSRLGSRKFDPWLRVPDNFISGRTEAYKNMALARAKDSIRSHVERIECVSDAFELIGKYIRVPITAIETPESPNDDGPTLTSSAPVSLANGAGGSPAKPWLDHGVIELNPNWPDDLPPEGEGGGSPAPTEAEQAILDRLLKPGEMVDFESGLDHEYEEYQCYLCSNWFFADQMKTFQGNRYCYSCRQEIPIEAEPDAPSVSDTTPVYETTLFDEPMPEGAPDAVSGMAPALPGANGQAVATPETSSGPPAMTVQDPYDEMLSLAKELFPLLSSMECMSTYGINGRMRRFIDLFGEIHSVQL